MSKSAAAAADAATQLHLWFTSTGVRNSVKDYLSVALIRTV